MNKIIYLFIIMHVFTYSLTTHVYGDVVLLSDDSVSNGKVIKKNSEFIIIRNSCGSFKIFLDKIEKIFITDSYQKDIELVKKYKLKVNESEIRQNYEAGIGFEYEEKEHPPASYSHMLCIMGDYNRLLGDYKEVIDDGYSIYLSYAHKMYIADLVIETGYYSFSHSVYKIHGPLLICGISFSLPREKTSYGNAQVSLLGGVTYSIISHDYLNEDQVKYSIHGKLGYHLNMGRFIPFINLRYLYNNDIDHPLHSVAFEVGAGFYLF